MSKKDSELQHYSFGIAGGRTWHTTNHIREFTCRIDGIPKAQQRNFATTTGQKKRVHLYDISKNFKKSFATAFSAAMRNTVPIPGFDSDDHPFIVKIRFYFPRPKHHYNFNFNTKELKLSPLAPLYHSNKPDVDNCTKLVMDAIQGLCYTNDSSVAHIDVAKLWIPQQTTWAPNQNQQGYTIIKISQILTNTYDRKCNCLACKEQSKRV